MNSRYILIKVPLDEQGKATKEDEIQAMNTLLEGAVENELYEIAALAKTRLDALLTGENKKGSLGTGI